MCEMTPELEIINNQDIPQTVEHDRKYKLEIVWRNVVLMGLLHISALYGVWLTLTCGKWQTVYAMYYFGVTSAMGVLAGAHRLWSHRSYKAKWQLRVILAVLETMALQNDIYEWCRDHRVHHKYSETDADPHNSNRGFFFAHMGWLMCKKHPEVMSKGANVGMSDIWADPIVRFQRKYYIPLVLLIWGLIPTYIPHLLWRETLWNSFFMCVTLRYCFVLHNAWLVNSAAHFWGNRPYNKEINPRENQYVQYLAYGEGYHNFHHTFPWDYSASEWGWQYNFNTATLLIDFFAWIGWAYDLKKAPHKAVSQRKLRFGEQSCAPTLTKNAWLVNVCGCLITMFPVWLALIGRFIFSPFLTQTF